jgi:hypothetical protein
MNVNSRYESTNIRMSDRKVIAEAVAVTVRVNSNQLENESLRSMVNTKEHRNFGNRNSRDSN